MEKSSFSPNEEDPDSDITNETIEEIAEEKFREDDEFIDDEK
jgi:hypothetical protein